MQHSISEALQVAQVPIISHQDCIQRISGTGFNITENMICAGGNGADACQGDSGGPLTCAGNLTAGEEGRYLCGIVSWGFDCVRRKKGSKTPLYPGFYTDVTKYTSWIKKFMRIWWRHYWSTYFSFYSSIKSNV